MRIRFIQTADACVYTRMLNQTSKTVGEFCLRNGYEFEKFVGIKRGYHAWQATYNRIPMLKSALNDGYRGWICYLDADAYVQNLDFDLDTYLQDKIQYGMIIARSGAQPATYWEVNAGVFLINLASPGGRQIVEEWHNIFMRMPDEKLFTSTDWTQTYNDQRMLQDLLRDNASLERSIMLDEQRILNYERGIFIRQMLRVSSATFEDRCRAIETAVQKILPDPNAPSPIILDDQATLCKLGEAFLTALYRVFLLREPDKTSIENHLAHFMESSNVEFHIVSTLKSDEFKRRFTRFCAKYGLGDITTSSGNAGSSTVNLNL